MPAELARWLLARWPWVVVGLFVAALVAWTVEEYDADRDAKAVGEAVGDRARRSIGGLGGFVAAVVVGVLAGVAQAGVHVGELVDIAPSAVAGAGAVVLGWLGMVGAVRITPVQYLGVGLVLVGVGMIAAAAMDRDGMGER